MDAVAGAVVEILLFEICVSLRHILDFQRI